MSITPSKYQGLKFKQLTRSVLTDPPVDVQGIKTLMLFLHTARAKEIPGDETNRRLGSLGMLIHLGERLLKEEPTDENADVLVSLKDERLLLRKISDLESQEAHIEKMEKAHV